RRPISMGRSSYDFPYMNSRTIARTHSAPEKAGGSQLENMTFSFPMGTIHRLCACNLSGFAQIGYFSLTPQPVRNTRVAPFAGAWIETLPQPRRAPRGRVAPCAGAWIETNSYGRCRNHSKRRSLRGSVDRNLLAHAWLRDGPRRSLRGSVDRNLQAAG